MTVSLKMCSEDTEEGKTYQSVALSALTGVRRDVRKRNLDDLHFRPHLVADNPAGAVPNSANAHVPLLP